MRYHTPLYPGGPDEPWDDTICATCQCDLPEADPDPANDGTSPWWEGYCSEPCRKGVPVPTDAEMLAKLDAYGHLTYTVGFSDESDDAPEDADRGDWLACCDYVVWKHPSRGVLVAYHVVVNSDSGGFIETVERGVVTADKAPFSLPDYWASVGMRPGTSWTEAEVKASWETQAKWAADLKADIETLGSTDRTEE
jgi:hypothetical protein